MPYDFNQQNCIIKGLSVPSASLTLASLPENSQPQHGTINPLQQPAQITYSFLPYPTPETLYASTLLKVSDDHNVPPFTGLTLCLCDPVSKLYEGSPLLLFLYDFLIPFSDFMSGWS